MSAAARKTSEKRPIQRKKITARSKEADDWVTLFLQTGNAAESYKQAYGRPDLSADDAANRAYRLQKQPKIQARLASLRRQMTTKSESGQLLTLNQRLAILAKIAKSKTTRPSDKTRALDVYARMAGDSAPTRMELSGPNGGAVPVSGAVAVVPAGEVVNFEQKLAALRAKLGTKPQR